MPQDIRKRADCHAEENDVLSKDFVFRDEADTRWRGYRMPAETAD
jgi:hypothetical protein